ncbi:MAG: tagatose 6-phosphate kinase [Moorella sp. (in: firmicutes)]|nr:tagatose 6-phosphate kinase [Moorella sp. (in: firmicutes)]
MITSITTNVAIDKMYIVDNFKINSVFRVKSVVPQAGGKGLNLARVVKTLGEEVVATGFIGGNIGNYIKELLAIEGLQGDFVEIAGESRTCLNILDPVGKTQTELLEPGPEVTPAEAARLIEKVKALARRSKVVTMSGSLIPGLKPDYYGQLIKIVNEEGALALLDTSGQALAEGIKARPYMIKPNQQEAESLVGRPLRDEASQKKFLKDLLNKGIKIAIISLASDGALIGTEDSFFKVIPPAVKAVNTVGCGDAFVAGFAVGLARGQGIIEVIRLATATATASATSWRTGQCSPGLIEELQEKVQVCRL